MGILKLRNADLEAAAEAEDGGARRRKRELGVRLAFRAITKSGEIPVTLLVCSTPICCGKPCLRSFMWSVSDWRADYVTCFRRWSLSYVINAMLNIAINVFHTSCSSFAGFTRNTPHLPQDLSGFGRTGALHFGAKFCQGWNKNVHAASQW